MSPNPRTAFARAHFSGCSSTTNAHSETGQMAVCCQNLTLGALSGRSALSVSVGALFKKFGLFLNTRCIWCIKHHYSHNYPLKFNGLSPFMCVWTTKVLNSLHLKDKCWKPCASFCSDTDEIHVRNLQSGEPIHRILSEQENVQRRERKRHTRESEVSCRH